MSDTLGDMGREGRLRDLLKRVEAATGHDDSIDVSLYAQFWEGFPIAEEIAFRRVIPPFTKSIDAALALVEKVLPGCQKSLIESPTIMTTRGFPFSCDLYDTTGADGQHYGRFQGVGWEAEGAGNSFPLAILAAALLAALSQHGREK